MKKLSLIISLGFLTISTVSFAQTSTQSQTPSIEQQKLQMAKDGCGKPIGFLPTPSKLACMLVALGVSEQEVKPKALAIIFAVCHGQLLKAAAPGVTPKSYSTLGECLNDPAAITLINKELTAQGFSEIKIVNPSILTAPAAPSTTSTPTIAPSAPAAPATTPAQTQ